CLKRAESNLFTLYCLQINLKKSITTMTTLSVNSSTFLPFDVSRIRSTLDEKTLSTNALQFMNELETMQKKRVENPSVKNLANPSNIQQLMTMMKGS
ncbi:unnamed protein product, partial [Didymodactylos carnosus]